MAPPDSRPDMHAARSGAIGDRRIVADAEAARDARRAREGGSILGETFLAHFLRSPSLVGGVVPSSRALARTLSRHASGFEAIVELGAGAGSVTRWLAADHPRAALTIVERDVAMARRIARGWPRARVYAGCVHEHAERLLAQPAASVAVSSLPFRSLPADLAQATIGVIERFLLAHPARRLVQYTYGLRAPFAFDSPSLAWRREERVWPNVPPATVWIGARTVPRASG